jgi:beta-glucosidase/6-phospho-beta-glucosidase/beta-galactosidase
MLPDTLLSNANNRAGDYPQSLKLSIKEDLPEFTPAEQEALRGSIDFIGVNVYTARCERGPGGGGGGCMPHRPRSQAQARACFFATQIRVRKT